MSANEQRPNVTLFLITFNKLVDQGEQRTKVKLDEIVYSLALFIIAVNVTWFFTQAVLGELGRCSYGGIRFPPGVNMAQAG